MCQKDKKMFMNVSIQHPKWEEWIHKTETENEKIAEQNNWHWYFDWFEAGDIIRYKYEQADKDPKVKDKYKGYDNYYKEHEIGESYVILGPDACFHHTEKPHRTWTEYTPCTNSTCRCYNPDDRGEIGGNCSYFGERPRLPDCFNELFAKIQAFVDVCGINEIDKLTEQMDIHPDIIGWFKYGDNYFKNKEDDYMKENMKYIYEKGKFEKEKKVTTTIHKGHDAGAVLCNQINCKKFNLIDNTLTNFKNKKTYGDHNLYTDYSDIKYIKIKTYNSSHKKDGKTIKGNITVQREGYEFSASNDECNKDRLFFHVDTLVELEVHFKNNSYKHLKCWGLVDNDDDYLIVYDPKKELKKEKEKLCNQIKEINNQIHNMENFNQTLELMNKIYDEEDCIIEYASTDFDHFEVSPPDNEEYYAMIEFFSTHLVMKDEKEYEGDFGPNAKFVKDAMKLIDDTYKRADEIKEKYKDQNVKVTIGEFNSGCEGGMALYIWVPYQNKKNIGDCDD